MLWRSCAIALRGDARWALRAVFQRICKNRGGHGARSSFIIRASRMLGAVRRRMRRRAHWRLFLSWQGNHPGEAGDLVLKLALLFGERGLLGDQLLVGCLKRCQPSAVFFAVRDAFSPTSNLLIMVAAFIAQSLLNAFRFGQSISQGFQLTDVFLTH